ncbi:hypothetical protein BP6252_04110 [Coleophoma cylindrospora]|uniref:Uncharacterized protein n=1 Tax=Coleophoma cylindrospora TaxID=1849047 RepID=A0A3D8RZK3_9HELO|nr:hypothetical protein BP6252_04110 [Coleophoma cylindrospora]
MKGVVSSLARRGVAATARFSATDAGREVKLNIPTWAIVMVGSTVLLFLVLETMAEYTFGRLIPTLIMVESPEAVLFEPLESEDPDSVLKGSKNVEPELLLIKQAPVTSSFRTTLRHLRARAGFWSRMRGFGAFICYTLVFQHVATLLNLLAFIPECVAPVLAAVLCSQLFMAWTHVVMSEPNGKRWFKRINFSTSAWKKIAGPTAVLEIAEQLTIMLPFYLFMSYGFGELTHESLKQLPCSERRMLVLKGFSIIALGIAMALLVVIPANVALVRVQASLLSENEVPIVPFDRSFGGKVEPEIVGGTGVLSSKDAWNTFDGRARVRLVKAYGKAIAIQVALGMLASMVVMSQVMWITKGDLQKLIPSDGSKDDTLTLSI